MKSQKITQAQVAKVLSLQAGRQQQAGASPADIIIYGGAAGGGKSHWLLTEAARHYQVPGYVARIFRRTYAQVAGGGGLWDKTHSLYSWLQGRPNEGALSWRFPSTASISFGHLQHEKDKFTHQGKEYAFVGLDEAEHFTWTMIWYLYSRNRNTSGVRSVFRMTTNPNPDHELREFILWWLDEYGQFPDLSKAGQLRWFVRNEKDEVLWHDMHAEAFWEYVNFIRKEADPGFKPASVTFIPASVDDNPALTSADPGYKARLMSLPYIERQRLLYGDWLTKPAAGLLFKEVWFTILYSRPSGLCQLVRYWDRAATKPKAGTDPDYTAGLLFGKFDGGWVILDLVHFRGTPGEVKRRIIATAEADRTVYNDVMVAIEEDPGQAGIFESDWYVEALMGHNVKTFKARDNKIKRAEPASAQAEQGKIFVMQAEWNKRMFKELEEFPTGAHDDIVDALSGAVMAAGTINDPWALWGGAS